MIIYCGLISSVVSASTLLDLKDGDEVDFKTKLLTLASTTIPVSKDCVLEMNENEISQIVELFNSNLVNVVVIHISFSNSSQYKQLLSGFHVSLSNPSGRNILCSLEDPDFQYVTWSLKVGIRNIKLNVKWNPKDCIKIGKIMSDFALNSAQHIVDSVNVATNYEICSSFKHDSFTPFLFNEVYPSSKYRFATKFNSECSTQNLLTRSNVWLDVLYPILIMMLFPSAYFLVQLWLWLNVGKGPSYLKNSKYYYTLDESALSPSIKTCRRGITVACRCVFIFVLICYCYYDYDPIFMQRGYGFSLVSSLLLFLCVYPTVLSCAFPRVLHCLLRSKNKFVKICCTIFYPFFVVGSAGIILIIFTIRTVTTLMFVQMSFLLGLFLNLIYFIPYFAFFSVLTFYCYTYWKTMEEKYFVLKQLIYEACREAQGINDGSIPNRNPEPNKDVIPVVPKELYDKIRKQLLPYKKNLLYFGLKMCWSFVFSYGIFKFASMQNELAVVIQIMTTASLGVMPHILNMEASRIFEERKTASTKKMKLNVKYMVEELIREDPKLAKTVIEQYGIHIPRFAYRMVRNQQEP